MPKRSEAADREALAALFRQMEEQPPVFACRALVRAAFLFTNSPSRPYHALGLNVSQADSTLIRTKSKMSRTISSISIQLTAKGVEFWRRLFPEVASSARELFEKAFRPEQMKQFSKLLALLLRSLEADSAKNINARSGAEPRRKGDLSVPIPQ